MMATRYSTREDGQPIHCNSIKVGINSLDVVWLASVFFGAFINFYFSVEPEQDVHFGILDQRILPKVILFSVHC